MTDQTKQPGLSLVPTTDTTQPVVSPTAVFSDTPSTTTPPGPAQESPVADELPIPDTVDPMLATILSWPRPHAETNEQLFYGWLKKKITALIPTGVKSAVKIFEKALGLVAVTIWRKDDTKSDVLFSCHVDTVDSSKSPMGERKKVVYDANFGSIFLDAGSPGQCLGADDGAGVWIMLRMIAAGKAGTYIFHRGEERGGLSAKLMVENYKDWLKQFQVAVAFDRPRNDEIIVTQGGTECASVKFGDALAKSLNIVQPCFKYRVSHQGVYTDTKEYRTIIHECINIGVGYQNQHTIREELDYAHLEALLDASLKVDWDILPVDRDASKAPTYSYSGYSSGFTGRYGKGLGSQGSLLDDDDDGFPSSRGGQAAGKAKPGKQKTKAEAKAADLDPENLIFDAQHSTIEELLAVIEQDSDWTLRCMIALLRENARLRADNRQLDALLGA